MVSPLARQSVVRYLTKMGRCSERHACVVVGLSRTMVRYIARRRKDEAVLVKEIHKLTIRHSRYGYRRITVLLKRESFKVNKKRVYRIWKSERVKPCPRVKPSIPASVVIEVLEWLFLTRGVPKYIRSDNGSEFVSKAVCQWLKESGCQTLFIKPGSPWKNGYIESFNDKLRDECLNREIFRNGREAQAIVEIWRHEYNNYRPYSSLGYLTPVEFVRQYYENNQAKGDELLREKAGSLSF